MYQRATATLSSIVAGRSVTEKPQRTQSERRATTRAALLEAALECLVEYGYAGTTTGRVCERAGVSRGAYLHHFGTRAALVAAALTELAERREEEFQAPVSNLPDGAERIEKALDLLWTWFTGWLFEASVDLAVAARTDAQLRELLVPIERDFNQSTLLRCREMFARGRDDTSVDQLIGMALGTVRGLAILPILQPDAHRASRQWKFAKAELANLFRQGGVGSGST